MSQLKLKSIFVVSIKSCILDRQNDLEKIRKSREYKQTRKQSVLKMHIAIVIAEEIQGLQRIAYWCQNPAEDLLGLSATHIL